MSVNNTTTNTGFFKRIGNWFNKNGNTLGQSMQLAGSTAVGVSLVGMMFHEMNKSSCCHHNSSIWGGGFGGCMSPWNSWNMGGCGMFGGMSMLNNMYSGTNPYLTMTGLQSASNYGYMNAMMARQNMYTNPMSNPMYQNYYNSAYQNHANTYLNNNQTGINDPNAEVEYTKVNNKEAGLTEAELTHEAKGKGDEVDSKLNKLSKSDNKFEYANSSASQDEKDNALTEQTKFYVAFLDDNSDGFVSEDEFLEHECEKTGAEAQYKKIFKQLDLNNDEKLDWKEYKALFKAYDSDGDGTITSKEYSDSQSDLIDGINTAIRREDGDKDPWRRKLKRNY